jgi:hypothetical protein
VRSWDSWAGRREATALISRMMVLSTMTSARNPNGIVMPFVHDGHGDLGFEADAGMGEFQGHALGKSWTRDAVDLDGKADDLFRECLVFEHEELPWCSVVLGVLRGKNFGRVNGHGHRNPSAAVDAPPDIPIREHRPPSNTTTLAVHRHGLARANSRAHARPPLGERGWSNPAAPAPSPPANGRRSPASVHEAACGLGWPRSSLFHERRNAPSPDR